MSSVSSHRLQLKLTRSATISREAFRFGTDRNPSGSVITLNSRHLIRDGRPWMPVMGEFHYTRHPEIEWREELLRMKSGGINIVATYVFWIHHEEIEDRWDWSGRRNLGAFIRLCHEVGLLVAVRCGPWCHGEVRNGGIPDWVLTKGWEIRSNDAHYLARARLLYGQIARQLEGQLWKDGGPVIVIQLENEYPGPAEHLLTLKRIARELGLDVPLYTRTGWPQLQTPLAFGEIAPLFGAYAEGFWDRQLTAMPGTYRAGFLFAPVRTESAIANEQLGHREAADEADAHRYPYLTCELGGGMVSSYHRRIRIDPADIDSVALVKIGSGGNLPGYYMYHGGTNPEGLLSTLMEEQSTPITNWNDVPVKNYDFYAPLGQYNQTRPHYHLLRRLHLLARDFGDQLAPLPAFFPEAKPAGGADLETVRWSVRSDGNQGFVFVNNHQRGDTVPGKDGVQFHLDLPSGPLVFPSAPVTVASGARFVWAFNLDLGAGIRLRHASAQPLCHIDDKDAATVFFAATPGVPTEFVFADGTVHRDVPCGRSVAFTVRGAAAAMHVVLLDESDSLALWKGVWRGRERVLLSRNAVTFDGDRLRLRSESGDALAAAVYPAPDGISGVVDGVFTTLSINETASAGSRNLTAELLRPAGPAREILLGKCIQPVAAAPLDPDFSDAAEWLIHLPCEEFDPGRDALLHLDYRGDVARVLIGGKLINDDFFNGRPLEIGLARYAAELTASSGELRVQILPMRSDAPIYLPADVRSVIGAAAELTQVSIITSGQISL